MDSVADSDLEGSPECLAVKKSRIENPDWPLAPNSVVLRRPVLTSESWQPYKGQELQGVIDALDTIRAIIESRFSPPGICHDVDDGGLFEAMVQDIRFLLSSFPELHVSLQGLVPTPEILNAADLPLYDSDIRASIFGDIEKAKTLVRRELLASGFVVKGRLPLYSMFDEEIADTTAILRRQASEYWSVDISGAGEPIQQARPKQEAINETVRSSRGRKPKEIPYEIARATYWQLLEDLESSGEHRKPTQKDVCDRLSLLGHGIGLTAFGDHVKRWRELGHAWPPAALE